MSTELPILTIPAFFSPPRTLREACRKSGHDEEGRRCLVCSLKYLCENDERWLVPMLAARPS
jgi:hypothetical protein